jgi:hypothetical protein
MNEEYLRGLHNHLGIEDDYETWINAVSGNDEYLRGLHGHIGVEDDYDTWRSSVFGEPVKKKDDTELSGEDDSLVGSWAKEVYAEAGQREEEYHAAHAGEDLIEGKTQKKSRWHELTHAQEFELTSLKNSREKKERLDNFLHAYNLKSISKDPEKMKDPFYAKNVANAQEELEDAYVEIQKHDPEYAGLSAEEISKGITVKDKQRYQGKSVEYIESKKWQAEQKEEHIKELKQPKLFGVGNVESRLNGVKWDKLVQYSEEDAQAFLSEWFPEIISKQQYAGNWLRIGSDFSDLAKDEGVLVSFNESGNSIGIEANRLKSAVRMYINPNVQELIGIMKGAPNPKRMQELIYYIKKDIDDNGDQYDTTAFLNIVGQDNLVSSINDYSKVIDNKAQSIRDIEESFNEERRQLLSRDHYPSEELELERRRAEQIMPIAEELNEMSGMAQDYAEDLQF